MSKHDHNTKFDKRRRTSSQFSEDSPERRGARVSFKNYLRHIKEQEMMEQLDDLDLDDTQDLSD